MKRIILILLVSLLLTGCSYKIVKVDNDIFQKKQECAGYKEAIESELGIKSELSNIWIETIFYSPKYNSCLYAYGKFFGAYWDGGKATSPTKREWGINDFFTKKEIYSSEFFYRSDSDSSYISADGQDVDQIFKEWRKKIEELEK